MQPVLGDLFLMFYPLSDVEKPPVGSDPLAPRAGVCVRRAQRGGQATPPAAGTRRRGRMAGSGRSSEWQSCSVGMRSRLSTVIAARVTTSR